MNISKKKITVFGSSVADGWTPYFISYMAPHGYSVLNRCIPGNNTINLIHRFESDVIPDKPDFVIVALSLANEGLPGSASPEAVYRQYRENLVKLIDMCKDNNIVPCLTTAYSCDEYTPEEWTYIGEINKEMTAWGIHIFDIRGALDDLTGHWIPGTCSDSRHPNAEGYQQIVYAIPPTAFEFETVGMPIPTESALKAPIAYEPLTPLKAFTLSAEVYINSSLNLVPFSMTQTSGEIFTPFGNNSNSDSVANIADLADGRFHTLTVSYVPIDGGLIRFYIDGQLRISSMTGCVGDTSALVIGSKGDCFKVRNLCVYRTRLDDDQILAIHQRQYPIGSLELFAPLDDLSIVAGNHLRNLASSRSYAYTL